MREALRPFLHGSDAEAHVDERVQGFRLLPPPQGSSSHLPLVLAESSSGICGRVWDSGVLLTSWLASAACAGGALGEGRALRLIELGAGVGVAGLAAAALGFKVLLTDLEEAVPVLRLNADANAHRCALPPAVAALEWGGTEAALREAVGTGLDAAWEGSSLVLCSDVVYEPAAYAPLITTMRQLASCGVATRTIMAHRSRHPDEHLFFTAAARHFSMRQLLGPPFVPLGTGEPSPGGDDGSTVRIFEFTAIAAVNCG